MKNLLPLTACATVALAIAHASAIDRKPPPEKASGDIKAPQVIFSGAKQAVGSPGRILVFKVINPNPRTAIPFSGYMRGGPKPNEPIKEGAIGPLYVVQERKGGEWKDKMIGWCGTGVGPVSLAPNSKTEFTYYLGKNEDVQAIKVGLRWSAGRRDDAAGWKIAWSESVSHRAFAPSDPKG